MGWESKRPNNSLRSHNIYIQRRPPTQLGTGRAMRALAEGRATSAPSPRPRGEPNSRPSRGSLRKIPPLRLPGLSAARGRPPRVSGRDSPASFGGRKASRGLASRESEASRPLPPPTDVRPARRGSGSLGSAPRRLSLSGEAPARQPASQSAGPDQQLQAGRRPPHRRCCGVWAQPGRAEPAAPAGPFRKEAKGGKSEKTKAKKKV